MKTLINRSMICLALAVAACSPSVSDEVNLNEQQWIHGSEDCKKNTDPAIQVVQFNTNTWILRQSKCVNHEATFMFLFVGDEKALLLDNGATENQDSFPIQKTVSTILSDWQEQSGTTLELIVAHTHKHKDHYAADNQFKGKPNTTVIGLEVDDVKEYFGIIDWPDDMVNFDLGSRVLTITPIPGHEPSSIAVYDNSSKILFTGDTFYPGRLYIKNWSLYKQSIKRLVDFTENHEIKYILGSHIEMSNKQGKTFAMNATYQPGEHKLPLTKADLKTLSVALRKLGDTPTKEVHDSFVIFPIPSKKSGGGD